MAVIYKVKPNGELKLNLGWRGAFQTVTITGGPFNAFKRENGNEFGVAVRAELIDKANVDLHLPIKDFDVPRDAGFVREAIVLTFQAAFDGKDVYVGCMGGYGRTGLFLALLAKAAGIADPVTYVRETYHPRAVETDEQYDYVENFDVSELRKDVLFDAWLFRLPRWVRG